jgi:hypothetical protein
MNTEVDGGTCWQCGTKRDRIAKLEAELARIKPTAQAVVDDCLEHNWHFHYYEAKKEHVEALKKELGTDQFKGLGCVTPKGIQGDDMRRNDELQNAQIRRQNFVLTIVSHIATFTLGMLIATVLTGS